MRRQHSLKRIGILALPGVQMLDVAGPLDVFAEANVQSGRRVYATGVVATSEGPVVASSGMRILPDVLMHAGGSTEFDTLLVAGAPNLNEVPADPAVLEWLRTRAPACRRFGSVCSGALILAATGLLDGKRVTTHWAVADRLAQSFPSVSVEVDALHVRDGKLRTAAGVTAGLDLALALVEEDLGREVAKAVASQLVMFFKRSGQLQFSRRGTTNLTGRSVLQQIQRRVFADPGADAGTAALAAHAGLSARHFVRLFQAEIGVTPASWVESVRVDLARRLFEAGEHPKQVAAACGYADVDTFRRAFQRRLGVTPAEYRRSFQDAT